MSEESKISKKAANYDAVDEIEKLSKEANQNNNLEKFIIEGNLKVE